jgi:hypothetical protein
MDTRLEAMERRVVDQNTSQLEDYHNSSRKKCNRLWGKLFGGKKILKEWGKQFIREGVM